MNKRSFERLLPLTVIAIIGTGWGHSVYTFASGLLIV